MDPLKPPYLALHLALARDHRLTRSSSEMDRVATYPAVARCGTSSGCAGCARTRRKIYCRQRPRRGRGSRNHAPRGLAHASRRLLLLPTLLNAQVRGVPVENIDRSVRACMDFDAYANGQWRASHPMPDIQTTWAIRTVTQEETRARLRSIAEEDAGNAASAPRGSPTQLVGDFYAACMDESRINAVGLQPLETILQDIDGIHDAKSLKRADRPPTGNRSLSSREPVGCPGPARCLAHDCGDRCDRARHCRIATIIYAMSCEIPECTREIPDVRAASADPRRVERGGEATAAVGGVMKIETALAQARLSRVELRNPLVVDHPMSFAALRKLAPRFDWNGEFLALGVKPAGHVNVPQPKLLQAL